MSHVNVLVCKQVPGAVIHPQTKHFNRNHQEEIFWLPPVDKKKMMYVLVDT